MKFPTKTKSRDSSLDEFFPTPRQRIIYQALCTHELREHFVKALDVEYEVGRAKGFEEAKKQAVEYNRKIASELMDLTTALENAFCNSPGAEMATDRFRLKIRELESELE